MSEYKACYIYTPDNTGKDEVGARPLKRRKFANPFDVPEQWSESSFVPLLSGFEKLQGVKFRAELFDAAWNPRQESLQKLLQDCNANTVNEVARFINGVYSNEPTSKIPTGLIVAGPSTVNYGHLVESIIKQVHVKERAVIVNLTSSQTLNLKSVLKNINQDAKSQMFGSVDDEDDHRRGSSQLNYDLQILHDHVKAQSIKKVVLSFQDSEAYEGGLLADLIDVLSSWHDRIPFVLLFDIATSIVMFQERLPRSTVRRLEGVQFDVTELNPDRIIKVGVSIDIPRLLWLGPGLSQTIIQRHRDYGQSSSVLVQALKYAYMTHLFANPLSVFLDDRNLLAGLHREHFEAVRNLSSFRRFVETLIEEREYETTRSLLENDDYLHGIITIEMEKGRQALSAILIAVDVLDTLQSCSPNKPSAAWSNLYIEGMSGALKNSVLIEDTLQSIRKLPSNALVDLLSKLSDFPTLDIGSVCQALKGLTRAMNGDVAPLRSEHDLHHETVRTTIVAQKVSLSKESSKLSDQDLAYSKIVNVLDTILREFFQSSLTNPQDLFLHEILIYDSKSPHRDVFTPKPRFAVERALSSPHDYLGCNCCERAENGLSPTQPSTAILYQLYLESGALINTADLWSAFYTIVGKEDATDEDADQQRALALFSRALAELKYMGMIKNCRKKVDHLAKQSWKGL